MMAVCDLRVVPEVADHHLEASVDFQRWYTNSVTLPGIRLIMNNSHLFPM